MASVAPGPLSSFAYIEGARPHTKKAFPIIAGLALLSFALHLAGANHYGFFRDELYYIACARHLDFGYVDQRLFGSAERRTCWRPSIAAVCLTERG